MTKPQAVNCYDYPRYWDFAFSDETEFEADFIEAVGKKYSDVPVRRMYEPGCGGGRLVIEMERRGYEVTACDSSQQSIEFLQSQCKTPAVRSRMQVGDMTSFRTTEPVDLAYCMVNTFRHLRTEDDARQHLKAVASNLNPGGIYIIGLHLMPPDADEDDSEEWTVESDDLSVRVFLEVEDFSRDTRLENVRFELDVSDRGEEVKLQTTYTLRLYLAQQMRELLASVPEFELCDVYDFCYEIDEPLELNDELGDTVLILRKLR
ncbi:MAG: class I SAM-dependent methyltransferase [Planctomycetaceae bacterium]